MDGSLDGLPGRTPTETGAALARLLRSLMNDDNHLVHHILETAANVSSIVGHDYSILLEQNTGQPPDEPAALILREETEAGRSKFGSHSRKMQPTSKASESRRTLKLVKQMELLEEAASKGSKETRPPFFVQPATTVKRDAEAELARLEKRCSETAVALAISENRCRQLQEQEKKLELNVARLRSEQGAAEKQLEETRAACGQRADMFADVHKTGETSVINWDSDLSSLSPAMLSHVIHEASAKLATAASAQAHWTRQPDQQWTSGAYGQPVPQYTLPLQQHVGSQPCHEQSQLEQQPSQQQCPQRLPLWPHSLQDPYMAPAIVQGSFRIPPAPCTMSPGEVSELLRSFFSKLEQEQDPFGAWLEPPEGADAALPGYARPTASSKNRAKETKFDPDQTSTHRRFAPLQTGADAQRHVSTTRSNARNKQAPAPPELSAKEKRRQEDRIVSMASPTPAPRFNKSTNVGLMSISSSDQPQYQDSQPQGRVNHRAAGMTEPVQISRHPEDRRKHGRMRRMRHQREHILQHNCRCYH